MKNKKKKRNYRYNLLFLLLFTGINIIKINFLLNSIGAPIIDVARNPSLRGQLFS